MWQAAKFAHLQQLSAALKQGVFVELHSNRLTLRQVRLSDSTAYHALLHCKQISEHSDIPHQPTLKRAERFVSWMNKLSARGTGCAWIIELKHAEELIGAIRINKFEKKIASALIGYEVHPNHWGKGYATEALSALVEHAHNSLELNRVEAWTTTENMASQRVLFRNGFQHEGTQRQKILFRGQLHDLKLFARLKCDPLIQATP